MAASVRRMHDEGAFRGSEFIDRESNLPVDHSDPLNIAELDLGTTQQSACRTAATRTSSLPGACSRQP